jgi:hypothetical protein
MIKQWILGIANATTASELVIVKEGIKHYLLTILFPLFNKIANEPAYTFFDNNRTADAPQIIARPNILLMMIWI